MPTHMPTCICQLLKNELNVRYMYSCLYIETHLWLDETHEHRLGGEIVHSVNDDSL